MSEQERIIDICLKEDSKNPIEIIRTLMKEEFVPMHGPIHHVLDGASIMVALKNSGLSFDLPTAFDELCMRANSMPGAICGNWGVCGSSTSIGAALSIIHKSGPLSDDEYYKDHMHLTSRILDRIANIGGPRCCKRNGFIAITTAIDFIKEKYGIELDKPKEIVCGFSGNNPNCIGNKCPFNKG